MSSTSSTYDETSAAKGEGGAASSGRDDANRVNPGGVDEGRQIAPGPSFRTRMAAVESAQNPLLQAAWPLLRALAEMPALLNADGVRVLHRLLEQEVETFHLLCNEAHIRHEHAVAASYALCTALDEAANSTTWGGSNGVEAGVWSTRQLAAQFHGDTKGGDKFFLLVGRLAASPREHIDLLELMYQVLGLGFEGRFSAAATQDGSRQLDTIRHRLLALLVSARGDVPIELSPHWRGVGEGKFRLLRSIPVWLTVVLLGLVLLGIFGWDKYRLLHRSEAVEQHIREIGLMRPAPAAEVKALRLKALLSAEIKAGSVSVDEDEHHSAVTFKGDDMFVPGKAQLNPMIAPVLVKVADQINQVTGSVRVTGYTDNLPIKTREFPNNQVLSEKRAAAAAAVLQDKGVVDSRMKVEGKGGRVADR